MVFRYLFFITIILIGCWSCANIVPLSGGEKDTTPPQLIKEASTPNFQTEFKKQPIVLAFDEWLTLKDAFNQVVVSPPLEYPFELSLKKKAARFTFDGREQLRENATYTINFGDAITDFTEGNVVPDLRFVFSTGRFIDSLEVKGTVVDAITGSPMENMRVMLYTNKADSVVRTERPFYFSKTDKSGGFRIQNVREDSFKVFVLDNSGLDYLYNSEEEQIGFLPEPIFVSLRSQPRLSLQVFKEDPPFRDLRSDKKTQGVFKITYNQAPDYLLTKVEDSSWTIYSESNKDTLQVWYQPGQSDTTELYTILDNEIIDTFLLFEPSTTNTGAMTLNIATSASASPLALNPLRPLRLSFNQPLLTVDSSLIQLLEDTLQTPMQATYQIDSLNPKDLLISYSWKSNLLYRLELDSSALKSWLDAASDTIRFTYTAQDPANFGNIKLSLTDLDSTQQYVLQLKDQNKDIGQPLIIQEQRIFQYSFNALPAATYQLLLTIDENRNGRWDTGNYDAKRQPEKQLKQTLEPLRANWDLEAVISFTSMGKPQSDSPPSTPEQ
jgi:hypothetical protein